jgi:hypothetical protein
MDSLDRPLHRGVHELQIINAVHQRLDVNGEHLARLTCASKFKRQWPFC